MKITELALWTPTLPEEPPQTEAPVLEEVPVTEGMDPCRWALWEVTSGPVRHSGC
jgi:hypothetical protein